MGRDIPKRSYADLEAELMASPFRAGQVYRHHSGERYRIIGITFDCKTNEMRLSYTKLDVPKLGLICFSRPAADFVAPRFTLEDAL